MYAEIFKLIDERLKANEDELKYLDCKVERLVKELKEKDEIIKKQSIIISGFRTPITEGAQKK